MWKFPYQKRKSSTKFCIKVRKPHFKLRKELLKKGLQRNCKKNVLEFDVDKDFFFFNFIFLKDLPFKGR